MSKLIPLLIFLLAGCFGPGNLQSRHSTDLESRRIRRIVILPALETTGSPVKVAPTPGEPKSPERDPNDTLARLIYQVMSGLPNWQIVSESEARESPRCRNVRVAESSIFARVRIACAGVRLIACFLRVLQ